MYIINIQVSCWAEIVCDGGGLIKRGGGDGFIPSAFAALNMFSRLIVSISFARLFTSKAGFVRRSGLPRFVVVARGLFVTTVGEQLTRKPVPDCCWDKDNGDDVMIRPLPLIELMTSLTATRRALDFLSCCRDPRFSFSSRLKGLVVISRVVVLVWLLLSWLFLCLMNSALTVNSLEHMSHRYCFSRV